MVNLPSTRRVDGDKEVCIALHSAYFQAEGQAKAVVCGDHAPQQCPIDYLLFIGPYWTHITVGMFTEAQLTVHTHKVSDSRDFWETLQAMK